MISLYDLTCKVAAMSEDTIIIPHYKELSIRHIVLDYNGTLAKDGLLKEEAKPLLSVLSRQYRLHVITADTFGSVHKQVEAFEVEVKVITGSDHTQEKADYVETLGAARCAAVGNGNNDVKMLVSAAVGIALLGDEGCSTSTMMQSDLVCKSIEDALELFIHPKRLIATLRS